MQFKNTFELISHIVKLHGVLEISFSPTPYGAESSIDSDIEDGYRKLLENNLDKIDEFVELCDISASHRDYKFQIKDGGLYGSCFFKNEYSSYYYDEDDSPQMEVDRKLIQMLSVEFECAEDSFSDQYSYELYYNTKLDKFKICVAEWDNGIGKEIPEELKERIKTSLVKIIEAKCDMPGDFIYTYKFYLDNEDSRIFQYFDDEYDLDLLLDDELYEY